MTIPVTPHVSSVPPSSADVRVTKPYDIHDGIHGAIYAPAMDFDSAKINNILVLDFDDTLKDEQTLNYHIAHNALKQVAHEYGETYPLLRDIASAVDGIRADPSAYRKGMPVICMSEGDFAKYAFDKGPMRIWNMKEQRTEERPMLSPFYFACAGNRKIQAPHLLTDLVNSLYHLDPKLDRTLRDMEKRSLQVRERLTSILFTQFLREYHENLARKPEIAEESIAHVSRRQSAAPRKSNTLITDKVLAEGIKALRNPNDFPEPARVAHVTPRRKLAAEELPYKHAQLAVMPGCLALLNRCDVPGMLLLIVSNRNHRTLMSEVGRFRDAHGLKHGIHAVCGTPNISYQGRLIGDELLKPNHKRLAAVLEELSTYSAERRGLSHARLILVGDSLSDVTQANELEHAGPIEGFVVTPYRSETKRSVAARPRGETTHPGGIASHISATYASSLDHVTEDIICLLESPL